MKKLEWRTYKDPGEYYPDIRRLSIKKKNDMKKNMGLADRAIRVIIALVLLALYYTGTIDGTLGIILIALSLVFVLTSLLSFCPLYLPFRWSSLQKKHGKTVKTIKI